MTPRTLLLSDGSRARVITAGAGEPLLLIHGVGMRAEVWAPQIAALQASHLVIAVDMPGHGDSDPLPPGAALPDFVGWAARVIAALGLGPMNLGSVNVAGHSMGALIALGLAVDRPDLIRRVAALCAVHRRSAQARAAVIARAEDIARGKGDLAAPLDRWFEGDSPLRAEVAGYLATVSLPGYAAAYRAFAEGDATYADRLPQITCPALLLTAEGDGNSTPDMTRAMAAAIPGAVAQVIAGHRHMVPLTAPQAVNRALAQWLSREKVPA